jgi:vacuolar-type H+-ATPase subunit I/STV1
MADIVKSSAESVRKAVRAGMEPASGIALVMGAMIAFGIIMGLINQYAPAEVKQGMANPMVEPIINLLQMALLAAALSTFVIDGVLAKYPQYLNTGMKKFMALFLAFALLLAPVLYLVNMASGRLAAYSSYVQQTPVEKALCKKHIDEAIAALNAEKAKNGMPQDGAEQVAAANGSGVPEPSNGNGEAAQPSA